MKHILLAVYVVTLFGCTSEVSREDLVGHYVLNTTAATETLDVRADGSYLHSFRTPGIKERTQTGTWTIEPDRSGGMLVTFDHFVADMQSLSDRGGYWPAAVERRWGRLRLVLNDEARLYYEKR